MKGQARERSRLFVLESVLKRGWQIGLLIVGAVVFMRASTATSYAYRLVDVGRDGPAASVPAGEDEQATEHLWLERPFPAGTRQWIEHTFCRNDSVESAQTSHPGRP